MPRPLPDPVSSAPMVVAFCLSTVAAAVVAGGAIGQWLYTKYIDKEKP